MGVFVGVIVLRDVDGTDCITVMFEYFYAPQKYGFYQRLKERWEICTLHFLFFQSGSYDFNMGRSWYSLWFSDFLFFCFDVGYPCETGLDIDAFRDILWIVHIWYLSAVDVNRGAWCRIYRYGTVSFLFTLHSLSQLCSWSWWIWSWRDADSGSVCINRVQKLRRHRYVGYLKYTFVQGYVFLEEKNENKMLSERIYLPVSIVRKP